MIELPVLPENRGDDKDSLCNSSFPVSCAAAAEIERYIDTFWPVPHALADLRLCDTLSVTGDRRSFDRAEERFRQHVVNHVGEDAMRRYEEYLVERRNDDATYHSLNTLVFETGLSDLLPAQKVFRDRSTLIAVTRILSQIDQQFSVLDLGCGDARTAVGLLGYFENIRRVYAVDINEAAISGASRRALDADSKTGSGIADRLTALCANYTAPGFSNELARVMTASAEVVLALYPFKRDLLSEFDTLFSSLLPLLRSGGTALVAAPMMLADEQRRDLHYVEQDWNRTTKRGGFRGSILVAEPTYGPSGFMLYSIHGADSSLRLS